jgi:hypothetical protein
MLSTSIWSMGVSAKNGIRWTSRLPELLYDQAEPFAVRGGSDQPLQTLQLDAHPLYDAEARIGSR